MVHPRAGLAHIGEANAELQKSWKFVRFKSARRDADLVDRAPKAIAGMRVVVTYVGGSLAGSGADEDQAQTILKLVRKFFHRVGLFAKAGECGIRIADRSVANERGGSGVAVTRRCRTYTLTKEWRISLRLSALRAAGAYFWGSPESNISRTSIVP